MKPICYNCWVNHGQQLPVECNKATCPAMMLEQPPKRKLGLSEKTVKEQDGIKLILPHGYQSGGVVKKPQQIQIVRG